MRNQEKNSRTSTVIALALGVLVMTLATPAHATSPAITVLGTSMNGSVVNVTVKNFTLLPRTGTVSVQAVVNDTPIWSFVPVVLLPGQTATVSAGFSATVSSVVKVGIQDDQTPY